MPRKDKALLLSGSQGAVRYLSAAQGSPPKIPLNISVTNASVRRAAFGQLSPERRTVTWRCFIWSDAFDCAMSPRRSWRRGESRSHFSLTLTNSRTSPALAPTSHLPIFEPLFPSSLSFDSTTVCLPPPFISLHFGGNELLSSATVAPAEGIHFFAGQLFQNVIFDGNRMGAVCTRMAF